MTPMNINLIKKTYTEWRENDIYMDYVRLTRWQDRDSVCKGLRELRSKKHQAIAIGFDEIGNTYALEKDGSTKQFCSRAEEREYGIVF